MSWNRSTAKRRRRTQFVAWGSIVVTLVGLTITPGIEHGDVARNVAPESADDDAADDGVVVYRRVRPARTAIKSETNAAVETEVAHHGADSNRDAHFVHTHDGRNPHVHYTVLGLELTIPAADEEAKSETLVADAEDGSPQAVESPAVPTLSRPAPRTGPGELPAAAGGYTSPARVALPDPTPGQSLFATIVWPASPILDGDAPVPRPPRV